MFEVPLFQVIGQDLWRVRSHRSGRGALVELSYPVVSDLTGTVQQKEIFGQNLDRQVMDSWIWVFVGEQDNQTLVMAKLINLTINMAML